MAACDVISHGDCLYSWKSVVSAECCSCLLLRSLFAGTHITTLADYFLFDGKHSVACILMDECFDV